jgi:F-type H+-transporting ATPase subunit epsilon
MTDAAPSFHLKVITPRSLVAETEVEELSLPTLEGYIGVLPGHRPLYVGLGRGVLSYRSGREEKRVAVEGGFAQVGPEAVLVLTELSGDDDA